MAGDPLWIDAITGTPAYAANELRITCALPLMYDGRLLGARSGVRPGGTALKVTLVSTTITTDTGVALIDPGLTTGQGPYWCALPAQETHTLTAADATNPRKDIVVAHIYDGIEDGSGLRTFRSDYLVGTPAASPVEPTLPASCLKLARIDVPQSGGGAAVVTDTRQWTVATGGILPVNVAGDIAAGVAGRYRHRLDTGALEVDSGAAWVPASGKPDIQRFTASGTYNKPAGAKSVRRRVWGSGAAGGGAAAAASNQHSVGSGGGAGGYAESWTDASTVASSVTVTVGAGGTGVSGAAGNNGNSSSFGTDTVATGGTGGITTSTSAIAFGIAGGAGGIGTAGDILVKGGGGSNGWGDALLGTGGEGGSSTMGGGAPGTATASAAQSITGVAGGQYGGGGGGALSTSTGAAAAGGAGAGGYVIVETFYS